MMWVMFSDYFARLPSNAYVCLNNIANLCFSAPPRKTPTSTKTRYVCKSIKKTLKNLDIPFCMSRSAVACYTLYQTGGPIAVTLRGSGDDSVEVYAWPHVDAGFIENHKEHLVLLAPEDMQDFILRGRRGKSVEHRLIHLVRDSWKHVFAMEDIILRSCELAGIINEGQASV
jgi:hypothetical protein